MLAAATIVAEHYARGGPADSVASVLAKLIDADPGTVDAVVRGLAKGWPSRTAPILTNAIEEDLEKMVSRLPPEKRGLMIKLATSWGSKRLEKLAAEASLALAGRSQYQLGTAEPDRCPRMAGNQPTDVRPASVARSNHAARARVRHWILSALQISDAPEVGSFCSGDCRASRPLPPPA